MIERKFTGSPKTAKKAVSELFPELSYSELCACFRRRDVKCDGKRIAADEILSGGLISVYPRNKKSIRVLFEDENLLACYKPKGTPSEGNASFEEIVRAEKGDNVRLAHRLDTNTDGILLFSKNPIAEKELYLAMKEGKIEKTYLAEVYGFPRLYEKKRLDCFYKKDDERSRALISDLPKEGFIPVSVIVRTVKENENGSTLSVTLHKGKMHQIRAILAHFGWFILGDGKYGDDRINKALGIKKHRLTATSVTFCFSPDSPLYYLNAKNISL